MHNRQLCPGALNGSPGFLRLEGLDVIDERSPRSVASSRGFDRLVRGLTAGGAVLLVGWLVVVIHFVVKFW